MPSKQPQFKLAALRRKNELLCRIDMWGFVSIMLVFLFLLMPWTVVDTKYIPVDLAIARHSTRMPGALGDDALIITITRDGMVFFRQNRASLEYLADQIGDLVGNAGERRIYLKADARAKYGDVAAVLDQIRKAGVENVSLLTEQPHP